MTDETTDQKDRVRKRFGEIFVDADIDSHPLYQNLINDLGSRTFQSIMADLEEAASHRQSQAKSRATEWRENLSV